MKFFPVNCFLLHLSSGLGYLSFRLFLYFSQFDAEFRRFSVSRKGKYDEFHELVEELHHLSEVPFLIHYIDPKDGDLLPINNDDNLGIAAQHAMPLLRIIIQRKGKIYTVLSQFKREFGN